MRFVVSLALVALYTLPLLIAQWMAVHTRLFSDTVIPRLWHSITLWVLRIRVQVIGAPAAARPLLIAANHVSWTDIPVLGSLMPVHFIAKADMGNWPVLGTFARLQRSVFVERGRRRSSTTQAREIAERLAKGDPMVLFAEGTTGDGNRVLPFNSTLFGAAQLAREALDAESVAVQPVAILYKRRHGLRLDRRERAAIAWIGEMDLVPHLKFVLNAGPLDVEVRYGDPVIFAGAADRKAIARETETQVRHMLITALRSETD